MRTRTIALTVLLVSAVYADSLTLKSGRSVNGTYLGGTARQVRMEVGDRIETFDITDVATIQFGGPAPMARRMEDERPRLRRNDSEEGNVFRPENQAAPAPSMAQGPLNVELPGGTNITIRMIDAVDSERNRVGDTFRAALDEPIMADGRPVVQRGADVVVKLVDDKESGKLTGRAELTLDIVSVNINGRMVDLNTATVQRQSSSRGGETAKRAAGVGAVGAVIGAIAGGGKGAAIGAAAGGAAGAGSGVITKGQRVRIPSESRLTFSLETPTRI